MKNVTNITLAILCVVALCAMPTQRACAQAYGTNPDSLLQSNIKGPLEFKGFVKELSKKLKGAIVTLYESPDGSEDNLVEITKTVTPGSGLFEFKLEVNKFYLISVEKAGYTTKKIDIDTDVTMAREQYTKVPTFSFEVDMVPDLDGLDFAGSVASVFYQIKRNEFDYQLDYSKEEMEEEERLLREQEEKRKLAELAAQKKFELEEAARLLREKENASAQEIIEAAVTVGDGDKAKTVEGFLQVFSEADTLREKKAEAMYAQLQAERKTNVANGAPINFQAIFNAAKTVEEKAVAEAEKKRTQSVEELRKEKEEAARKMEEAMALKQQALELESKEKFAAAIKAEELRKAQEQKEKKDKVYYAIFNAGGDAKVAIDNLQKTYAKNDPYKEEKAKALYAEYEKTRLTGTTLSQMDFGKLFAAADKAETEAIQKEIKKDNNKQQSKLDAFMQRVEEKKKEEQAQVENKIKEGLKNAKSDRISQVAVFKEALAKNDPYKDQKANAMYEEYVKKKQNMGGTAAAEIDFSSLFSAAETAEAKAKQEAKEKLVREKEKAQQQLEAQREKIRQDKAKRAAQSAQKMEQTLGAKMAETKNKKERKLAQALEAGAESEEAAIEALLKVLDPTYDKDLDRERAQAIYNAYQEESNKIRQSGKLGTKIDFDVLFQAADKAELDRLQRQFEQKQAEEEKRLAAYTEQRIEKATQIAKAQQEKAEQEARKAEVAYEETLHKVQTQQQERLAAQKKQEQELAKQVAMEQAKREAVERERAEAQLAKVEAERERRLAEEKAAQEALAAAEAAEKARIEKEAQQAAAEQLALAEKARKQAEEAKRKAEEEQRKEEEKRLAAAAKAQKEAELAAKREQERLAKEEAERLVAEAKAKEAAELAAKREQERLAKEEAERLAAEAKAKEAAELAAKREQERLAKEEAERLAAEAKAREEAKLAAAKAAEEARIAEEKRQAELAAQQAAEAERKRQDKYNALINSGNQAMGSQDFTLAKQTYSEALAMYPNKKEAQEKLAQSELEIARVEKENAERIARDKQYNQLMEEAELAVKEKALANAIQKFEQASALKPNEEKPKQRRQEVQQTIDELAQAEEERQAKERQYIVLMQEGSKALAAQSLLKARESYQEAANLKPNETEPVNKLKEIDALEEQLELAELAKKEKEAEAKRKFEEQKQQEEQRKAEELAARMKAINEAAEANAGNQDAEQARIEKFEKLRESIEQMDMAAEEQRKAFLSELAKIYPEGMTKEQVQGKNFELLRYVINNKNVVTVYEKKTWDWGGVFYFKDADIAITEAIYKLEIGKYE